jgi:hypothetical protein
MAFVQTGIFGVRIGTTGISLSKAWIGGGRRATGTGKATTSFPEKVGGRQESRQNSDLPNAQHQLA